MPAADKRRLVVLVSTDNGIIGAEIKGRADVVPSDITVMKEVAAALKKQWVGGIVVYQGDEIRKLAEPGIWAVPSRRLFT